MFGVANEFSYMMGRPDCLSQSPLSLSLSLGHYVFAKRPIPVRRASSMSPLAGGGRLSPFVRTLLLFVVFRVATITILPCELNAYNEIHLRV